MNVEDDDSENDSDYVPTNDKDDDSSGDENGVSRNDSMHSVADLIRKRKVDSMFDDMMKEEQMYDADKFSKSVCQSNTVAVTMNKAVKAKKISKAQATMLASIFGKTVARSIMAKNSNKANNHKKSPRDDHSTNESSSNSCSGSRHIDAVAASTAEIRERALKSAKSILKKTTVTEKKKFAGEEILVEKTVLASSSASSSASAVPTKSGSSLDAALEILKGPKAISTVVKSSNDWDNFKEKEGLQDDLAAASKDGYLERKDFLNRVDLRQFEKEKEERNFGRASSSKK